MAKYENKQKKDPYIFYKLLCQYLIDGNENKLQKILQQNKDEVTKLKNRAILHLCAFPDIIYKYNLYFNDFNSVLNKFSNEQYLRFFNELLKNYNLSSTKLLYFPKYNQHDFTLFADKIKKYNIQCEMDHPSSDELACLYDLYKNNIITDQILDSIIIENDSAASIKSQQKTSKKLNINLNTFNNNEISSTKNKTFNSLYEGIKDYIKTGLNFIQQNRTCKYCKLFKNSKIFLDTNVEDYSNGCDVLFIGLNPYTSDAERNLPMSGKESFYFRTLLDGLIAKYPNIKYSITNLTLCINEDPNLKFDSCIKNCNEIAGVLLNAINPKIIMTFGDKVMKHYGIKGPLSKNNGQIFNNKIIPTVELSKVEYNIKSKEALEKAFITLFSIFEKYSLNKSNKSVSINNFRLKPNQIINKLTDEYTILDIKQIQNQLIYIMKDKIGNKKYFIEDAKMPIYIKYGEYKDCKLISKDVDAVCYLNAQELEQLNRKLYQNMNGLINK